MAGGRPPDGPGGRLEAGGAWVLRPGDVLAGRFVIAGMLGRGGTGEVYEAEDRELGAPVALKTLRRQVAGESLVLARFRREILLARRVSHANVCRTFDVFRHTWPALPGAEPLSIIFMTMELLRGPTLAARLRAGGRLPVDRALPLVHDMAAGLAAAHRVGVVHRDFKSGNVLLVPGPQAREHAVITDFGLARAEDGSDPQATGTASMVGTSAYMAPEQVEGRPVTAAADIYALGVVLFELSTGRLPFLGDSALSVAVKRLQEAPPPPRSLVPDLPRHWEEAILRCLALDPTQRFARVEEVAEALGADDAGLPTPAPLPVPARLPGVATAASRSRAARAGRPRARSLRVALVLVAVAAAAGAAYRVLRRPDGVPAQGTAAPSMRRSLAVLGFRNLDGRADHAWLAPALAEMLSTEIGASEGLRRVPGESVAEAKVDLAVAETDALAGDTLAKLRQRLGADLVVLGSYLMAPAGGDNPKIRLDLCVQDTRSGEVLASLVESGVQSDLGDLVSRAGTRLRARLGVATLSDAELAGLRASHPARTEAARLYAQGLQRLRLLDALAARDLLEGSVAAEPDFALARAALARTWYTLGMRPRARDEARRAFELSGKLPRVERLSVEALYHELRQDWPQAVRDLKQLSDRYPDDVEHGLSLARVQVAAGDAAGAKAALVRLRRLPPPSGHDPRIDLAEAETARLEGDAHAMLAAAERAARQGRHLAARLLVARAELQRGWALRLLGRLAEALEAHTRARAAYREAGDLGGVAWSERNLALVRDASGDAAGAESAFREALALFREVGDYRGLAATRHAFGIMLMERRRPAEARRELDEALTLFRAVEDHAGVARALLAGASVAGETGDTRGAHERCSEARRVTLAGGLRVDAAEALVCLADLDAQQGRLEAACHGLELAVAELRAVPAPVETARVLTRLGRLEQRAHDVQAARRAWSEALQLRLALRQEREASALRALLAELRPPGSPAGAAR